MRDPKVHTPVEPGSAASALRVRLLGPGQFELGVPLRFAYAKAQALLLLLMLEPTPWPRDRLTGLLWPRQDSVQARSNLRNALHLLRRLVGTERVVNRPEGIGWCAQPGDETDLMALGQMPLQAQLEALSGYHGELMAGFTVPEAPGFMEWLDVKRLACQAQVIACTDRLFDQARPQAAAQGSWEDALQVARLQVRIDPWNERLQHRLIEALAEAGQLHAALAQWDVACELFQRQLDAQPGAALQALARRLRGHMATPATLAKATVVPATVAQASSATALSAAALLHVDLRVLDPSDVSALPHLKTLERSLEVAAQASGGRVQWLSGGALVRVDACAGRTSQCELALAAALEVLQAWRAHPAGDRLAVRLGLHRGPMLPAQPDRLDPLGQMAGVAAGLASSAQAGEVLASLAFAGRLSQQPWVSWQPPSGGPPGSPSGSWMGMPAMRWAGQTGQHGREPSPLLGRASQQSALQQAWQQAQQGGARALLIQGSAGSGKSRLVRWALAQVAPAEGNCLIECQPSRCESPGAPLAAWLMVACGLNCHERQPDSAALIRQWVLQQAPGLPETAVQTLQRLLGLLRDDESFTPTRRRQALVEAFAGLLRGMFSRAPGMLVVEDVHWADATTLAVLEAMPAQLAKQRVLMVATARPGEEGLSAWPRVEVKPLTPTQSLRLARYVFTAQADGAELLGDSALSAIVKKADGNPLFIESLASAARQAAGGVPASLEEGLLWPLKADADAQTVAHAASVLGEVFDLVALRALCQGTEEAAFQAALRRLKRHGLMASDGPTLRFRHALICDAVYASLSQVQRRELHAAVVRQALLADPGLSARQPLWLAQHAEQAGQLDQSAQWYEQAALQSMAVAAFAEAQQWFGQALALVERMPVPKEGPHRAMRLALGRAQSIVPMCGYGAERTREAYQTVLTLGAAQPGSEQVFQAHFGLWLGSSSHAGYLQSLVHAERLQRHADLSGSAVHRVQSHYAWGNSRLWVGELAQARHHLEQAVQLAAGLPLHALVASHSEDSGVSAGALLAWVCWLQGDEALSMKVQAQTLARTDALKHPYSTAFALACAGRFAVMRGDAVDLAPHVDRLDDLSTRHELGLWKALVSTQRGWLHCVQGKPGGAELAAQGVALGAPTMPSLEVTLVSMQADGLHRMGDLKACARVVDHALQRCNHWGDRYMQPELLRLAALCERDPALAAQHRARARAQALAQGAQAWLDRLDPPLAL